MSDAISLRGGGPVRLDVRAAVARAAQATQVDFDYLLGQARLESGLDPRARAGSSSAAGLYQFTQGTWLETLDRHGPEHGLGWASAAIEGGRVSDPALRQQILDMRHDPTVAALMAGELAGDNRTALTGVLGREPDPAELYLAHFLGTKGASRFLTSLAANPGQNAAALFPDAAQANRPIFYTSDGDARSLGGVMELMRSKMSAAMAEHGGAYSAPGGVPGLADSLVASVPERAARPSMADTLAATFGTSSATPPSVRDAYRKLKAFGL